MALIAFLTEFPNEIEFPLSCFNNKKIYIHSHINGKKKKQKQKSFKIVNPIPSDVSPMCKRIQPSGRGRTTVRTKDDLQGRRPQYLTAFCLKNNLHFTGFRPKQ